MALTPEQRADWQDVTTALGAGETAIGTACRDNLLDDAQRRALDDLGGR